MSADDPESVVDVHELMQMLNNHEHRFGAMPEQDLSAGMQRLDGSCMSYSPAGGIVP